MPHIIGPSLSRRTTLGGLLILPLAGTARAQDAVKSPAVTCNATSSRMQDTIYEYDTAGKCIEWDFPSGEPSTNGLTLKGLGLQKTGAKKNTSDLGFSDAKNLASRFLNQSSKYDWHPASLWSLQFAAKAVDALKRDEDKQGATSISDEYFAYQRVGGVNPSMLHKVGSDRTFGKFMQAGKSYYSLDYHALSILVDNDHVSANEDHQAGDRQRYGYQPKALFEADGKYLKPIAIQIKRGAKSAIVQPGDPDWEIAKFIVQNADINYHQVIAHLGRTHLVMESIAVATGKCLPKKLHPISVLLRPHFEGTINITDFATTDLINISPQSENGGVFDLNFTGTMASNITLVAQEVFGIYDSETLRADPALAQRSANRFNDSIFPRDIANRGVGHFREERIGASGNADSAKIKIPVLHVSPGNKGSDGLDFDYPYLEDGCQLWNALTDWVCRYVDIYYQDDAAVQNDCELQHWARTLVTEGKINGFGEYRNGKTLNGQIHTRAYLVQALSGIIFIASVQHAAVNFSQAHFGETLPAGIYHDYFEGPADITSYLPNEAHFKEVMQTLSILASSQYTTLGKYHDNSSTDKRLRSVTDYFKNEKTKAPLKQLRMTLKGIESDIKSRGSYANGHIYNYLQPSRIPQSTNI
ncbi:lipoxygenase family protein [Parasphingorhabdus sp.]|uniref:lipoxygenase family protein n=1 Tax=Parasphingorhabdus sp. TaxID=2709688 RepID=UPI003D2C1B81